MDIIFSRLLLFYSILIFEFCSGEIYKIGAILDKNSTRGYNEIAIKVSVAELNQALTQAQTGNLVEYVIKEIEENDSFAALHATCELIEENVIAILGPTTEDNSNVVQSVCDDKEIPLLDVRWDDQPVSPIINFHPYQNTLTEIYAEIIRAWKFENFVILYENNESLNRVGELIESYEEIQINRNTHKAIVRQLDKTNTGEYRPVLKELRDAGVKQFVLDCSVDILEEVLKQAQQVGVMTDEESFIITNLDAHTLDLFPFQHSNTNITGMRFMDPWRPEMLYLADEISKAQGEPIESFHIRLEVALIRDAIMMFGEALKDLPKYFEPSSTTCNSSDGWRFGTTLINAVKSIKFPGITGNIEFDFFGYRSRFSLEVFELKEGGITWIPLYKVPTYSSCPLGNGNRYKVDWKRKTGAILFSIKFPGITGNIEFDFFGYRSRFGLEVFELKEGGITWIGNWTVDRGLVISRAPPPPPQLQEGSLVNRTFIITGCLTEPYVMTKKLTDTLKGNDQYEGYCIDLIQELSKMEGFNYTFKIRNDTNNGKLVNNVTGEWDGMIGEVMKNEAQLAVGDLTITSSREEAVDFTSPFMSLGIGILYKKFGKAPPSFFSFADPFALDTWKMLVAAFFVSSLALFILGRLCPGEWQNPYPCIEEPEFLVNQLSLRNCFWFMTGSIMQQGSEIAPIAISTRMVAGMWWFFTLIMVSSYTANLAAFLASEKPDILFSNLEELLEVAESKGIKYGAKKGGATVSFFKETEKKGYKDVYEYMMKHPEVMVDDNKLGVSRAEQGYYAFFMESTSIEYETQRHCSLMQVGPKLDEKGYGIAMRKNSSYRAVLSTAILKLQEKGVLEELRRKWWERERGGGQCVDESDGGDAVALSLKSVGGVFWVSVAGSLLSIIFVFCEMGLHVFRRSVQTKIPYRTLLMQELRFYFKFSGMVKPVTYDKEGSGGGDSGKSEDEKLPDGFGFRSEILGIKS